MLMQITSQHRQERQAPLCPEGTLVWSSCKYLRSICTLLCTAGKRLGLAALSPSVNVFEIPIQAAISLPLLS
ncbi:hypothetical protein CH063_03340 [Colletotrichum higginsianum]|uniref:Uncharacterized protein n=1 Tax=Colletotrichum higginsianum (strain IMI 349063) TaxID=759273 RepID=H1VW67_COLHI|nr:hypothetical protein CH063_03340 [Colletotrichum higginsianum]